MFSSTALRAGATVVVLMVCSSAGANAESLKAALTAAYANNPNITSALLSVNSAAENVALAKSGKLPSIGVSASATESAGIAGGQVGTTSNYQVGLSYQQTLFDNLKTDANIEQARALAEASTYALRNEEQNVLLSVVNAYMSVILNTQLVKLRQDTMSFYQTQVKASQDRLKIGEGTKIDVSQAQASLASAVASYKAAIAGVQSSQASYVRWVGHKPQNLSGSYSFGSLIPSSVDRAIALADDRHPAILAAKAAIRAAQAGSDAANAAFGPTVSVVGTICGLECGSGSINTSLAGSVKLSLNVPIYEGGALGAGVRKANIGQIKSSIDAQSARDQVNEAVVTSWSALQNAIAQIDSANSALAANQLSLDGVIQERDVGQQTTLDVLNAEATLTTSKEAIITATSNRITAAFSLIAATGRLSARDLGLATPTKSGETYAAKVEDVWGELRSVK